MHTTPRLRRLVVATVAGLALLVGVFGCSGPTGGAPPTSVPPLVASTLAPTFAPRAAAALQFPAVGSGAVGVAAADGTVEVLGRGGSTATVPMASITKVITSLVVLGEHPLSGVDDQGPTITLGQADLDITEAVERAGQFTEPMYAGQEVTLHDALAITLLTSANNYAESIALWAFGSEEAYLAAARAWLASHGLTETTLGDASGLDPGSASSTSDLLRVAALAHADPALAHLAGLASFEQKDLGTIENQNVLLGENGIDGLKTGSTSFAGFTLLTSAVVMVGQTPVTLVAVVLGTDSLTARFDTTRALLASAEAGLAEVELATAGQVFGDYALADGSVVNAVATDSVPAVVFGDTPVATQVMLEDVPVAAVAPGRTVGSATFTVGSATYRVPLVLE